MLGLPRKPAAENIYVNDDGEMSLALEINNTPYICFLCGFYLKLCL